MKNKNTYKNIFTAFLLFSIFFGGVCILLFGNMFQGIVLGIFSGIIFAAGIGIFSVIMAKKMKSYKEELEKNTVIFYDGAANHQIGMEAVGGWLFLLEEELSFISHKVNFNVHECRIAYKDIQNVQKGIKMNSMIVVLRNGEKEEFIVNDRKEWIQKIETQINR